MADRSVTVSLYANATGYVAGVKAAQTATTGFMATLEKSAAKQQALRNLGNAAGVMGLAFGAGVAVVVGAAANFDKAMSKVQAATHETEKNMDRLRAAAIQAGADTAYSASEAAGGIEALAKAGVSTSDILRGGLNGALALAAAGGQDVGEAAETAAQAMNMFQLAGKDMPHVADLLAAAAGKASGEVSDLAMALKMGGLVANQTGLSIEETTGALAAFASKGLIGSDAGTSFKTMLQSLVPTTDSAGKVMDQLGISAFDSQGNFIGLAKYAGVLKNALSGYSVEARAAYLKTMFGSDAIRAASIVYQEGSKGIQEWINKVNDQGFAAETAAIKMDNLAGDLEKLKGSLETAFIGTGEGAQGPLRSLTQNLTELVNAYIALPSPVKGAGLQVAAFLAVLGGSAFVFTRVANGLIQMQETMRTLGMSTGSMSKKMMAFRAGALGAGVGLKIFSDHLGDAYDKEKKLLDVAGDAAIGFGVAGPWGAAVGAAVGVLSAFTSHTDSAIVSTDDLTHSLNKQTFAITKTSRAQIAKALADDDLIPVAHRLGFSVSQVTDAMLDQGNAAPKLIRMLDQLADNINRSAVITKGQRQQYVGLSDDSIQLLRDIDRLKSVVNDQSGKMAEARQKAEDYRDAQISLHGTFSGTTNSVEQQTGAMKRHAYQMGVNKKQADDLRGGLSKIPNAANFAERALGSMSSQMNKDLGNIDDEGVNITLSASAKKILGALSAAVPNIFHAAGGPIYGPGTGTSDDIPAWLSDGERVTPTAVINKAGGGDNRRGQKVMSAIERMIMRGQMAKYGDVPAFATGGAVVKPHVSLHGEQAAVGQVSSMFETIAAALGVALSKNLSDILTHLPTAGQLGPGGVLTPAQLVRGQDFAQSQAGKPYVWTGVGPGGYDCSGFQSAVLNSARGAYPYSRIGSTATMPWPGSAPGVGRYSIGWSTNVGGSGIGHTSGNIGGLGVESNGSSGVVVGSGAMSPLDPMFSSGVMHYDKGGILRPGLTLAYNGTGENEHVLRLAKGGPVHGVGTPSTLTAEEAQQAAEEIAHAVAAAWKHFGFGPKASADTIKSELNALISALRDALGKDAPVLDRLRKLGDNLVKAAKAQDRMSAHLDRLREARSAYASSVAGTFQHDLFGVGAEGLLLQLHADRNDARKMNRALHRAKGKGLDGPLFKALAASGDLDTAQQLAAMTPAQIRKYELAYKQRQKQTSQLGQFAGNTVFGQQIKQNTHELHHLNKRLHHLEHAINHMGHHVQQGAHKGTRDGAREGAREQGRRVAHGIR